MATAFPRALGGQPQDPVYQMLMTELQQGQQAPQPTFSPDEVRRRIVENNSQVNLGLLGQMSGDDGMRNVGGQIFQRALAGRNERVTNRGVQDPLTGETSIDPEYTAEKEQTRRNRIFEKALAYEGQRSKSEEQKARDAQQHEYRIAEIRSRTANRQGTDAEMLELKKDLVRSQIGNSQSRADAAAEKAQTAKDKMAMTRDIANNRANLISSTVDKALGQTGTLSTGLVGSVIGRVPGSEAYDLRKTVDTIKANIGFQELQDMRNASPTGGALGQVAVKELDMLQATLGNLDANQSEDQLRENLNKIREHVARWRDTVRAGSQDRSVSPETPDVGSPAPALPQPVPAGAPALTAPGGAQAPRRLRLDPATGRLVPQ
jgi:hypothetical protein